MAEGAAHLAAIEPRFARALELTGPLPLRRRADGFETLFSAIVSQQVSTAAATAIWNRLEALGATEPAGVLAASDEALRAAGLSRQKVAYGRAIAVSGLDFRGAAAAAGRGGSSRSSPGSRASASGPPRSTRCSRSAAPTSSRPGDLALQDAARRLFELEARPSEKALREMSLAWSPWRAVAARLLWAYYRVGDGARRGEVIFRSSSKVNGEMLDVQRMHNPCTMHARIERICRKC